MMKKLVMVALALSMATAAMAQRVQLGVRAGIFSQDMDIKLENVFTDSRLGFHAAVAARIRLAEIGTGAAGMGLFLQPEIVYSQNSYKIQPVGSSVAKIRMQTVDVPVLLSFKLSIFRIQAGPVFNVLYRSPSNKENVDFMWKKPTVGYSAGLSVDIFGGLVLDGRYNGQFNELKNNLAVDGQSVGDSVRASLSGWSLGLSWMF